MKVELKLDESYTETKVLVYAPSLSDEVQMILSKLSEDTSKFISGIKNEKIEIIDKDSIIKIYANSGKVYAMTEKGEYIIKLKLYEVESRLNPEQFVRISNSEIINFDKVKNFDLSFTGTICIKLIDGTLSYVSRRSVSKIKKILGL